MTFMAYFFFINEFFKAMLVYIGTYGFTFLSKKKTHSL